MSKIADDMANDNPDQTTLLKIFTVCLIVCFTHSKQLKLCRDGQLLSHTVPGHTLMCYKTLVSYVVLQN